MQQQSSQKTECLFDGVPRRLPLQNTARQMQCWFTCECRQFLRSGCGASTRPAIQHNVLDTAGVEQRRVESIQRNVPGTRNDPVSDFFGGPDIYQAKVAACY